MARKREMKASAAQLNTASVWRQNMRRNLQIGLHCCLLCSSLGLEITGALLAFLGRQAVPGVVSENGK